MQGFFCILLLSCLEFIFCIESKNESPQLVIRTNIMKIECELLDMVCDSAQCKPLVLCYKGSKTNLPYLTLTGRLMNMTSVSVFTNIPVTETRTNIFQAAWQKSVPISEAQQQYSEIYISRTRVIYEAVDSDCMALIFLIFIVAMLLITVDEIIQRRNKK